jgi:hypothetical protein
MSSSQFQQRSVSQSPSLVLPQKKKKLTHTNSDKECLRSDAGWIRRLIYTIDIHNGFKFFNLVERTALHVVVWLCFATIATYSFVFLQGLYDGLTTPDNAISATAATATTTEELSVE